MDVKTLAETCRAAVAAGRKSIALVLPGDSSGGTRCLCGRHGGPRGEVVSTGPEDSIVAFCPRKILAFLAKNHLDTSPPV